MSKPYTDAAVAGLYKHLADTGTILFQRTNSWIAKIIRKVEGDSCNHVAVVTYDNRAREYVVIEMHPPKLVYTKLMEWIRTDMAQVVAVAKPKGLTGPKRADLAGIYTDIIYKDKPRYDYFGLFGFLRKSWRRVNSDNRLFCSELVNKMKLVGIDICPGQDERIESPQDMYNMIGKTLEDIGVNYGN